MAAQRPIRGHAQLDGSIIEQLAWGDGVHDDTQVLQSMLDICGLIWLPPGVFNISSTLMPPRRNGCGIIGSCSGPVDDSASIQTVGSVIRATDPAITVIKSPSFVTGPVYKNLVLDKVPGATGGYGLDMNTSNDHAEISNLFVDRQYIGLNLATTGYSKAEYIHVQRSVSHGFLLVGQWQLGRLLATMNGGMGFAVTNALPDGNSLGQWTGLSTYANKSHGICFMGKVFDIRLSDSFFGGDGGLEIYGLQEGNNSNVFTNVVMEAAGSPFSVYLGPGSGHNSFVNCGALGGVAHGLVSYAPHLSVIGGAFTDFAGYGILSYGGKVSCQGVYVDRCGWGIGATADVANISVMGCDLSGCTIPLDVSLAQHSTAYGNL